MSADCYELVSIRSVVLSSCVSIWRVYPLVLQHRYSQMIDHTFGRELILCADSYIKNILICRLYVFTSPLIRPINI